jgi:hypothetical protein
MGVAGSGACDAMPVEKGKQWGRTGGTTTRCPWSPTAEDVTACAAALRDSAAVGSNATTAQSAGYTPATTFSIFMEGTV